VRQQLVDPAGLVCGQPGQQFLEVRVRVAPTHACRLDQTHTSGRPLARVQAAGEQPVDFSDGNGPDLVLDPVVVRWQLRVIDKARERRSALEDVVQRLGRGRVAGHLLTLQHHPLV